MIPATIVTYFRSIFVFTIILSERYAFDCACDGKTESSRSACCAAPFRPRLLSHSHIKKSKPTMTGGRINWAGEEHFAYSRPSGPCLDRTFNAIVSICTAVFPRRASKSLHKSIFIPSSCWSCLWKRTGVLLRVQRRPTTLEGLRACPWHGGVGRPIARYYV